MQWQPSSIEKKIFAGFGSSFVVLVLISLAVYFNNQRLIVNRKKVADTEEVLRSLGQIVSTVTDAETGMRGFVLTGREQFLKPLKRATNRVISGLQQGRAAVRTDKAIEPRLAHL